MITNNDYSVQVVPGPLIAPIRTMGLGGAYIGFAEGVEGTSTNVAAPSVREPFSTSYIDYDITTSLYLPGVFAGTDFENRGKRGSVYDGFLVVGGGGVLRIGSFGVAGSGDVQSFRVRGSEAGLPDLSMQIVRYNANISYAFLGDQVSIGVGVRAVSMLLSEVGTPAGSLVSMGGVSPQAGVLIRPDDTRFRFGGTVRAPVLGSGDGSARTTQDTRGVRRADGFVLPRHVQLPAEFEAGIAVQLGPRELNPIWQNPHDQEAPVRARIDAARQERKKLRDDELSKLVGADKRARGKQLDRQEDAIVAVEDARLDAEQKRLKEARSARFENMPRARIMIVASLLAIAPSDRTVAVSSFLSQRYESYGQSWTLTPRFGLESEPIVDRLVLRLGGYVEPARFDDATPRQHLTFGSDVKLFTWDVFGLLDKTTWKIGLGVDLAPRYTNWGLGIGVWR